jgi:pimeloyl-ACP methyl ester carboxylesterase
MWHETERGDLYVRDSKGFGVPIIFFHPFPFDGRIWEPVGQLLQDKARIIIPDLPGFGASNDMNLAEMSVDLYASTVLEVLNTLGVDTFIPIGCSLGSYVVMSLMAHTPERLLGAGICNGRSRADTEEEKAKRKILAEKVLASGVEYLLDKVVPKTISAATEADKAILIQYVQEQFSDGVEAGLYALAGRPDRTTIMASFEKPILSVVGQLDQVINREEQDSMRALMKRPTLCDIKDAGHLSPFEKPVVVAKAIFDWMMKEISA